MFERIMRSSLSLLAVCVAACGGGGGYEGTPSPAPGGGGGESFATVEAFVDARIKPRLDNCRTCHVPGGVGDITDGRRMKLSTTASEDDANLRASWTAMGGNNPTSRILLMASGEGDPHTGGTPWPVDSDAYKDIAAILACYEDSSTCMSRIAALGGGNAPTAQPLLGSRNGSSYFENYCEGRDGNTPRADDTVLPSDPREQVVAGFNAGKAVYFNAYYENCLANQPEEMQLPKTCGEYRTLRTAGAQFLNHDDVVSRGTPANPAATPSLITADEFNAQWQNWGAGLTARPAEFDEARALFTGQAIAPFHNPYPLPGEDPNATNGGSGKLPLGMVQTKDGSGNWTGMIATDNSCVGCHASGIGTAADGLGGLWGLGAAGYMAPGGSSQGGQTPDAVTGFEIVDFVLKDWDSLDSNAPGQKYLPTHRPSRQDGPQWWNMGSRVRKFFDGGPATLSLRILTASFIDGDHLANGKARRDYSNEVAMKAYMFTESLRSPKYPASLPAIDTALAEQGAVLFHTKDLWAYAGNENAPKPLGGNGSCASCHGAYSPRYVNDTTYVPGPEFEGIAGHISPINVIGTERHRADQLAGIFADVWARSWWSYPEGQNGYVDPDTKSPAQEAADENLVGRNTQGACGWRPGVVGYQAPPLYGVWASAPYFHNGSVPDLESVLDPTQRPSLWRRQSQTVAGVIGFDSRLSALDTTKMGWKYTTLTCDNAHPYTSCDPVQTTGSIFQTFTGAAPVVPPANRELRMTFNTQVDGNSNAGHEFTKVLSPQERKALIEYLKTL